jgi:glycosyltransferase involved in cell wall biosynthesis
MNILMLLLNQYQQGTFWRAYALGKELVQKNHSVTLVITSPKNRFKIDVITENHLTIVQMPDLFPGSLRSGWDPWNITNRIWWLKDKKFDLVHAFESRPSVIFPTLTMKKKGIPLIMDWSDWFGKGGSVEERANPLIRGGLRPIETFFEEHYRIRADGTTVICSALAERAVKLGIDQKTILYLPNGSDTQRIKQLDIHEAKNKLGIAPASFNIGYVGSIFPKDAVLMAQAFDRLAMLIKEARLYVLGYCPIDIRSLSHFPNQIVQTGFLSDELLNQHLGACDVFWLPLCNSQANRGRSPHKLMDYMAAGRPIVATDVGDVRRIMGDEIGLISEDDPECLAQNTRQLFDDPLLRIKMGQTARLLAMKDLSWKTLAASLEEFYVSTRMQYLSTQVIKGT